MTAAGRFAMGVVLVAGCGATPPTPEASQRRATSPAATAASPIVTSNDAAPTPPSDAPPAPDAGAPPLPAGWHLLGSYPLTTGRAYITDPAYRDDTSLRLLVKVQRGTWQAAIDLRDERDLGMRVAELITAHESVDVAAVTWQVEDFVLGVDSGTAGVFDVDHFHVDAEGRADVREQARRDGWDDGEAWYQSLVMDAIESGTSNRVLPHGVITSTGFGDGGYDCYTARNKRKEVIAVRLVFLRSGADGDATRARVRELFEAAT